MASSSSVPPSEPIGQILKRAGLLNDAQIQIALSDQTAQQDLLFGEVLVLRGWLKAKTLDFFLEHFVSACRTDQVTATVEPAPSTSPAADPPYAKTKEEDLSQFYSYAPPTGARKIPPAPHKVVKSESLNVLTGSRPLSQSQAVPVQSKPPSKTTGSLHIHGYCVQVEEEDEELHEEDWSDLDIADNPRYLR